MKFPVVALMSCSMILSLTQLAKSSDEKASLALVYHVDEKLNVKTTDKPVHFSIGGAKQSLTDMITLETETTEDNAVLYISSLENKGRLKHANRSVTMGLVVLVNGAHVVLSDETIYLKDVAPGKHTHEIPVSLDPKDIPMAPSGEYSGNVTFTIATKV